MLDHFWQLSSICPTLKEKQWCVLTPFKKPHWNFVRILLTSAISNAAFLELSPCRAWVSWVFSHEFPMISAGYLEHRYCVKAVQIWSFFWSTFCRIWTEYGEIFPGLFAISKRFFWSRPKLCMSNHDSVDQAVFKWLLGILRKLKQQK